MPGVRSVTSAKIRGLFDPFLIKGLKYPVRNKSHKRSGDSKGTWDIMVDNEYNIK